MSLAAFLVAHRHEGIVLVRIEAAEGYNPEWQDWPIPQPKDGLKVTFTPL